MRFFFLAVCVGLFGQSSSFLIANGISSTSVYPIDLPQRGFDLVKTFTYLNTGNSIYTGVALQTSSKLYFNVQSITPATNYTIFIVGYATNNATTTYVVIPVEQIVEIVYNPLPQTFNSSQTFGSNTVSGVLPYYSIEPSKRAADIQWVVANLSKVVPYTITNILVQTTLTGSYGAISCTGSTNGISNSGTISYVQGVTLVPSSNGTLMLVTYFCGNNSSSSYSVIVAPNQVTGITYTFY